MFLSIEICFLAIQRDTKYRWHCPFKTLLANITLIVLAKPYNERNLCATVHATHPSRSDSDRVCLTILNRWDGKMFFIGFKGKKAPDFRDYLTITFTL